MAQLTSTQRYFVRLAYRGTHYRGWQRQPGGVISVQATIERTLSEVNGHDQRVVGCGRTDAGVHAADYYLHFDGPEKLRDNWLFIVNKRLPPDIRFHAVWPVASNAHTRYDARRRTYAYHLHTRPDPLLAPTSTYLDPKGFSARRVEDVLPSLHGERDFRGLCLTPDRHNTTVCTVEELKLTAQPTGYLLTISADRFLRGMIRMLTAHLLAVGYGHLSADALLQGLERGHRSVAGIAPPEGLRLAAIVYDDERFIR